MNILEIIKHMSTKGLKRLVKKSSNVVYDETYGKMVILKVTSNRVKVQETYGPLQFEHSIPLDDFASYVKYRYEHIRDLTNFVQSSSSIAVQDKILELNDCKQDIEDVIGTCTFGKNIIQYKNFEAKIDEFGKWTVINDLSGYTVFNVDNCDDFLDFSHFLNGLKRCKDSLQLYYNLQLGLERLVNATSYNFEITEEESHYIEDFISNEKLDTLSLFNDDESTTIEIIKDSRISYRFLIQKERYTLYDMTIKKKELSLEQFKQLFSQLKHIF